MSGGGSSGDQKTTTTQLAPEQRQLLDMAMPFYQQFAAGNQTVPGASGSVSPFDPLQTAGQGQVLGATGTQADVVGGAADASKFLTSGDALNPNTNPALGATIDASVRPIYENLTSKVLPNIRGDAATSSGGGVSANYGGSRQGIAEGIASRSASQAAGDTAAKVATAGYNSGLDAQLKAMGLAPQTAQAQAIPGISTSTVGDVRQGQTQKGLTADVASQQFAQWLPYIKAMGLTNPVAAIPGAGTTTTGTGTSSSSGLQTAVGLGSIASGMMGSGGIASLLPFLSDAREKEDIEIIGKLANGLNVYRFRYKGYPMVHMGLMAQDVEVKFPDAVRAVDGVKFVDYDRATRNEGEITA